MTASQTLTEARFEDLESLIADSPRSMAAVLQAIHSTLTQTSTPEEAAWLERVESVRRQMEASSETIAVNLGGPEKFGSVSEIAGRRSLKPVWGRLMFNLVRWLRPVNCLELGTAVGLSGAFQTAALELNGAGRLLSLEGSAGVTALAERNFRSLNLGRVATRVGFFKNTLAPALEELKVVDFAFIDGHHDEKATVVYFNQILPYTPNERVLVFDDINWSDGMKRAWENVIGHERVRGVVDLRKLGICVLGDSSVPRQHLRFPRMQRSEPGAEATTLHAN